jgi:hypothetical protein
MLNHKIVWLLLILFAGLSGFAQSESDVKGSLDPHAGVHYLRL